MELFPAVTTHAKLSGDYLRHRCKAWFHTRCLCTPAAGGLAGPAAKHPKTMFSHEREELTQIPIFQILPSFRAAPAARQLTPTLTQPGLWNCDPDGRIFSHVGHVEETLQVFPGAGGVCGGV